MKLIKLFVLAFIVSIVAGCASNSIVDEHKITVGASVKESIEILSRRGTLNDSLCVTTSISVECELLGFDATSNKHQFMRFDIFSLKDVTNIKVSRWELVTSKKGDEINPLDLTDEQLEGIRQYIEKHRNRYVN